MKIEVPSGKYVLAVSGGVDSMTLLDLLSNLSGVDFIIAHFNHGTREDSDLDEALVTAAAGRYGRLLEIGRGGLGPKASEDTARRARYAFLEAIRQKHGAKKIITAHHQDDLIETALLNILRGTGRRGLSAMADNPDVLRPLLNISKSEIISYVRRQKLAWREDSTNQDTDYLRNYI
ncbi:MAG TPA: tRNA lysidine(34) synthetase TilS, partial [Candidatus Saccharimonadales bacterium]|nr:tRNA lysidine(34) synthetase TilS [Candidatus Saccharimonadales bacterium]